MPLKAYTNFSSYKLFMMDVGLLGAMADLDAESLLEGNRIFMVYVKNTRDFSHGMNWHTYV